MISGSTLTRTVVTGLALSLTALLSHAAIFEVTQTGDAGAGTLRQAILDANSSAGSDQIVFHIPTTDPGYDPATGVWSIRPLTELATLSNAGTLIDGTTQAAFIGSDTNVYGPEIWIDGISAGAASGITVNSADNVLNCLVISEFAQFGIEINGGQAQGNAVIGCYIGTDPTGTLDAGNGFSGVILYTGPQMNVIGGTTVADRNIISGNGWSGVEIQGAGADRNRVVGNFIGTNASGTADLGNAHYGVDIWSSAQENQVGGPTVAERNVISGNDWFAVQLGGAQTDDNIVQGNFIGTNRGGMMAIPNTSGGIMVTGNRNVIGGTEAGAGNLISGNGGYGVSITTRLGNRVIGNRIGTNALGTGDLGNAQGGVRLASGAQTSVVGPGNRIAFNGGDGVRVQDATTIQNMITHNAITANDGAGIENLAGGNTELAPPVILVATPTQVEGTAVPNSVVEIFSDSANEGEVYEGAAAADGLGNFVWVGEATGPYVTATATDGAGNTSEFSAPILYPLFVVTNTNDAGAGSLRKALSDANARPGAELVRFNIPTSDPGYDPATGVWTIRPASELPTLTDTGTLICGLSQSAYIGDDTNPYGPEIELDGTNSGTANGIQVQSAQNAIRALVINRFARNGVLITGTAADGNQIIGCYIGTDATGTADLGNGNSGVMLYTGPEENVIGGTTPEERNVISGNGWSGVELQNPGATANRVTGNYIGTDATGSAALGNAHYGVHVWSGSHGNVIGGANAGERNLVSGNGWNGIFLSSYGGANEVIGNYIGVDATGSTALANGGSGLLIGGYENVVGGDAEGEGNLISGNNGDGIAIGGSDGHGNVISGNAIGLDSGGTADLGNGLCGVRISSGAYGNRIEGGNRIAFNAGDGVRVVDATSVGNTITENSITSNTGLGIDNVSGGNTELPAPVITDAQLSQVSGTAPAGSWVEIFSDAVDEGGTYEGGTTADYAGNFVWSGTPHGPYVTATATDGAGNTSEFAAPFFLVVDGVTEASGVSAVILRPGFPDPFTSAVTFGYDLPAPAQVTLSVYDVQGRQVRVLLDVSAMPAGRHEAVWDGRDDRGRLVAPGAYFCRFQAGSVRQVDRLLLIR